MRRRWCDREPHMTTTHSPHCVAESRQIAPKPTTHTPSRRSHPPTHTSAPFEPPRVMFTPAAMPLVLSQRAAAPRPLVSATAARTLLLLLLACLLALLALATPTLAQQAQAKAKLDIRAIRSAAEAATSKGDSSTAIRLWTQIIDSEPSQITYFHRASLYVRKHQYAAALSDLSNAMRLDPKFTKGLMLRARVQKVTGNCKAALADLTKLLGELQPTHKEAATELPKVHTCIQLIEEAEALEKRREFDAAKHVYTQALDIAYDSNTLLLARVRCHEALGDWQSIQVDTRKILSADSSNLSALLVRGRAFYYLGEHDNALTHWKEGLRLDPEHRGLREATKSLRVLVKRIASADEHLAQAQGGHNKAAAEAALEDIDAALKHDPAHRVIVPSLLLKKASALLLLKRWGEAVTAATAVLSIDENDVEALCKRAEAKMGMEEWEQAIADYSKATQIDQQHHGAAQGLHHAQVELKKSQQKDFYKELDVPRSATARQIKKAYLKLAMVWHPDKHEKDEDKSVAAKKFQAIAEAYEVLSDPDTKGKYDRGEEWRPNQGGQQQQQHPHHHPFGGFHHGHPGGGGQQQQFHFRWG